MTSSNSSDLFHDMTPIDAKFSMSNEIELGLSKDFFLNKNEVSKQNNVISFNETIQNPTNKTRKIAIYFLAILLLLIFASVFFYFQLYGKAENSNNSNSNPEKKLENEVGFTKKNSENKKRTDKNTVEIIPDPFYKTYDSIEIPLKLDGTPDMRYKTNKRLFGNNYKPLKKDGTLDMRYKDNRIGIYNSL